MTAEEIDLVVAYRKLDAEHQAFLRGVMLGLSRALPIEPIDDDADEDTPPHRRRR